MNDNECIAKYVMQWQMEGHTLQVWWVDKRNVAQIRAVDFHPDTDLEQAMMVAEAMREMGFHGQHYSYPDAIKSLNDGMAHRFALLGVSTTGALEDFAATGIADRLETAIHAVAVRVARAMEAKDE